jgi:DNA-directed RNA polymerase specialized sigma24 family protein
MVTSPNPISVIPQHVLSKRASDLSRKIHASFFPWGFKVANLIVVLAGDSLEIFSRVLTGQFVLAGIRELPEIGGKPASDWLQTVHTKGPNVLPPGTGRELGNRVFKILLVKFSDPEIAQEAMSAVMLQIARGKFHIANGASIHEAQSYTITACLNAGRDILRARGRRREAPMTRDDDGQEIDIADPEAFRDLEKSISEKDMSQILGDAGRISPRAREYLEAILRGDSQSDWARDLGVTDAAVSKFVRKIRPTLQKVLENHLRSASIRRRHAVYDFR